MNSEKKSQLKKILVVDDEDIIRDLMGEILTLLGYEPILCGSPVDSIQLYLERHDEISLIFIDMIMPEISGRQLFDEFMKIDPTKKVIVLSGYSMEHETQKLLEDGVSAFVQKPVSIKELSKIISENIG
ncbi:MAG: response regulator [Vallitaleaceae bacterium]|nr:response regulator [Vallitaleaceae bacterium]